MACSLSLFGESQVPTDVLFQDDFSDPSSGWPGEIMEEFETGYGDGGFVISIKAESTMACIR